MSSGTRLANEAWEALFRAQAAISRELAAGGVWGDLVPRDYGALRALSTKSDGLRINQIGEAVVLTQSAMSRMIARHEAAGLVERVDDPDDGRAHRIRLTEAGARVQREVGARRARRVAAAMTRALDHDQLIHLRDLCRELT
jgi:DNA-binding MarR family transcriptional regulator